MQYRVSQNETDDVAKTDLLALPAVGPRDSTVQSIVRALGILDALRGSGPTTVTDLSRQLGMHKSTVHRLLGTLEQEGYVRRETGSERYGLGLKVLGLAGAVLGQMDVRQHALPVMRQLMSETDETVHLGTLVGFDVMCVESVVSNRRNAIASMAGKSTQAHVSSMGKVLLANLPSDVVATFLSAKGLPRLTGRTITERPAFHSELDRIRRDRYAMNDEEEEVGIRCIAAPIRDYRGLPIAALSVAAPSARLDGANLVPIVQLLTARADDVSRSLGFVTAD